MNIKRLLVCLTAMLLMATGAWAQTTIAQWTFETLPSAFAYTPGNGVSTTNFLADAGAQVGTAALTGLHNATPAFGRWRVFFPRTGCLSSRSLSMAGWTNVPGDYYQVLVSTVGYTNINFFLNHYSSATGPRDFKIVYSTDGSTFTQCGTYTAGNAAWTTNYFDFSSYTDMANKSTLYFRVVDNSTTSANAGTVGTGGTSRIDNVTVGGTVPGAPSIITPPQGVTNYFGDTATFTVTAGGNIFRINGTPTARRRWPWPMAAAAMAQG